MAKNRKKKKATIMKTSANIKNCYVVSKMPKIRRIIFGTFSKYFLKIGEYL